MARLVQIAPEREVNGRSAFKGCLMPAAGGKRLRPGTEAA